MQPSEAQGRGLRGRSPGLALRLALRSRRRSISAAGAAWGAVAALGWTLGLPGRWRGRAHLAAPASSSQTQERRPEVALAGQLVALAGQRAFELNMQQSDQRNTGHRQSPGTEPPLRPGRTQGRLCHLWRPIGHRRGSAWGSRRGEGRAFCRLLSPMEALQCEELVSRSMRPRWDLPERQQASLQGTRPSWASPAGGCLPWSPRGTWGHLACCMHSSAPWLRNLGLVNPSLSQWAANGLPHALVGLALQGRPPTPDLMDSRV